jgi:hypothetical protein
MKRTGWLLACVISSSGCLTPVGDPDAGPTFDAGHDAGENGLLDAGCEVTEVSTLPHVRIVARPSTCTFTLAQAKAGISIPWDLVIDQSVDGFTPLQPYSYGPDLANLDLQAILSGNGQRYCVCDQGLPYGMCPLSDGGTALPNGATCRPVTLPAGTWPRAFTWDGRNWNGPSDTFEMKGPAFPPGVYGLKISTAPGSLDGGGASLSASSTVQITLVP